MKYVLITCYQTSFNKENAWLCYGHAAPGVNESLGEYSTKNEALTEAFQHGVPVMLGRSYEDALAKLSVL